jgi:hypothetical protein
MFGIVRIVMSFVRTIVKTQKTKIVYFANTVQKNQNAYVLKDNPDLYGLVV